MVKDFFKPVSRSDREQLARKHAGQGEQSVRLEEVGLAEVARQAVANATQDATSRQNER